MTIHLSHRATAVVSAALSALVCAGIADAYDARLDLAVDNLVKASALLQASTVPDVQGQRCQKFVDKAVLSIEKTTALIEKTKTCAGA